MDWKHHFEREDPVCISSSIWLSYILPELNCSHCKYLTRYCKILVWPSLNLFSCIAWIEYFRTEFSQDNWREWFVNSALMIAIQVKIFDDWLSVWNCRPLCTIFCSRKKIWKLPWFWSKHWIFLLNFVKPNSWESFLLKIALKTDL